MNISDLLIIVFFLLPGYVAWEIANILSPNTSRQTEKQLLTAHVSFGIAVMVFTAILHGMGPPEFVRWMASPQSTISWTTYLCVGLITVLVAFSIAIWRVSLHKRTQRFLDHFRSTPYSGVRTLWDIFREEVVSIAGRELIVTTTDGFQFHGYAEMISTVADDQDIYLYTYRYWKLRDDGSTSPPATPVMKTVAFIKAEHVLRIQILRPEMDSASSSVVARKIREIRISLQESASSDSGDSADSEVSATSSDLDLTLSESSLSAT